MGCASGKSQDIPRIDSTPIIILSEEEEKTEEEEEEEKGSDFLEMNVDDAKEEIHIDDEPDDDTYRAVLPPEPHSDSDDQHSVVNFFEKWKPVPKTVVNLNVARLDITNIHVTVPNVITIQDIDQRARKANPDCAQSFKKLNQYLLHNLNGQKHREKLTVRALLVWLSHQDIDKYYGLPCSEDTPEGFLSLIAHKRTMYSTFFTVLCRHANILCIRIKGVSRCAGYEPGDESSGEDNWTSVYINNKWEIIHPFWVCRSLVGHSAGGWIKLEEMGKFKGHRTESSAGTLVNAFKEYYFLPNPSEFRYYCHPDDTKWQLTKRPLSRKEFFKLPYIFPTFFALGLKIVTESSCLLVSKQGESEVGIQAPKKNANTIELHYELFLKEQSSNEVERSLTEAKNLPRLVSMIRCADNWTFKICFPTEGVYKLSVYGGPYNSPLTRVSDFRIDCTKRKQNCHLLPFDPGRVGFGPGLHAQKKGLFVPSHLNGEVPASVNESIDMSFQIDTLLVKTMYVKIELLNNQSVATLQEMTVLTRQVTYRIHNQELRITTVLQQEGEYMLAIYTGKKPEEVGVEDVDESSVKDLENVCNYKLLTNIKKKEKPNQKKARQKLKDAVKTKIQHGADLHVAIETIMESVNVCRKQKIPDSDPEVMAAEQRVGFLKTKKDARDAILRRNVHVTKETILRIQSSEYSRVCNYEIEKLKHLEELLQALGAFTQEVPTLDRCIGELVNMHHVKPEVECTVLALLTLLEENTEKIETWEDMRDTLRCPKDSNVKTKMKSIQKTEISVKTVKRVKSILESHSLSAVQQTNMAAGEIYKWTEGVVSAFLRSEERE